MPEVQVDEDGDQGPPGLEAIPADEQATAPSTSAAATASPLCAWISTAYVMSNNSAGMACLFSPAQLASIHQTEMSQYINTVGVRNANNEVRADVNWQETLRSDAHMCEAESEESSTDSDETVGLFGLHVSELCLVTTRKCTLWPHTRTYIECQVICLDAKEGDLYLCETLPDLDWITAEGVIKATFTKQRWVHIDNDTENVFNLGAGTEVREVAPSRPGAVC